MYKSFQIIDDFIREVYGLNFIKKPMNHKIMEIKELKNAYDAIKKISQFQKKPLPKEFIKYVYPLLEVSVQWAKLRKKKIFKEFLKKCKQRIKNSKQSNFYGTIFEIDMASRCLLSNWNIKFVEDYTEERKQIDFVCYKGGNKQIIGVECLSKRYSSNSLTIDRINKDISKKAEKFKEEYIKKLDLNKRLLIIDITTTSYSSPKILKDLHRIRKSSKLDAVIFTWREDIIDGENHSLRVKYKVFGDIEEKYFFTTYAAEFRITNKEPIFFMRKCSEPEPQVRVGGCEEGIEDYYQKVRGDKNRHNH